MTFFDLQTCARCFTQKVGYEIGYNSSFMQQLPGKKQTRAFRFSASLSNAIKSLDCREWRKSLMQFSKSSPSSLLGSWPRSEHIYTETKHNMFHLRRQCEFTPRKHTCSRFLRSHIYIYIWHNWRHSLSKQVLHVKQHWLWRPIRETSQWSEYINGSSYLLFDTILKGVYPVQI